MHTYNETDASDGGIEVAYHRVHATSEQTHVYVAACGDSYVAIAIDVDPREYETVAGHLIAYDPTQEGAERRAERWMENYPKGILGAVDEEDGGGGIGQRLVGGLQRLNDYGNRLADQQQQPQEQQQEGDG